MLLEVIRNDSADYRAPMDAIMYREEHNTEIPNDTVFIFNGGSLDTVSGTDLKSRAHLKEEYFFQADFSASAMFL